MKRIPDKLLKFMAEQAPEEYLKKIDLLDIDEIGDTGYDEFGLSREYLKGSLAAGLFLYEKWFRVEAYGVERVPETGPALIISNHSGQIPLDGGMITIACLLDMEKPRMCRAMIEKWFPTLPFVGATLTRVGQVVGVTENAERLLEAGKLMMIFPEGIKGSGKTWDKRYQLQRFTLGFMELAIKFRCPIIPTAVIGGEEQAPAFKNIEWLADKLNMPYFPITPTFPWLGLLGFMPLPSKYRIYFGEPMDFSDKQDDLSDPDLVRNHVEQVKATIQDMVNKGLEERPFPGL